MLTDKSIDNAQSLLLKQFSKICGFQDTVDVIPTEKNYIQILHDSSLHWVCLANMESRKEDNEIHCLYDVFSLKKKHISKNVTAQLASYVYHAGPQLLILSKSVQQQCRLWSLCHGVCYQSNSWWQSREKCYDKKKVRPHIVECLKIRKLTPFPTIIGKVLRCNTAISIVELFCLSRVPRLPPTDRRYQRHNATSAKNGTIESLKRYLLPRL